MILRAHLETRAVDLDTGAANAHSSWHERRFLELFLADEEGQVGCGEAAPLPDYSPDSFDACREALQALDTISLHAFGLGEIRRTLDLLAPGLPAARFALESALLDLWAQGRGCSVSQLLCKEPMGSIPTCALLPPGSSIDDATAALARGIGTLKLKVGVDWGKERQLLREIHARYPAISLRLDANGAWSVALARRNLAELTPDEIEFVEQPVAPAKMAELGDVRVPLAADESLHSERGRAALEPMLADSPLAAFVLKPTVLGGALACLELAARARAHGLEVIVSHCFEGPVGSAAVAELALAIGGERAAGIDEHPVLRAFGQRRVPQFQPGRIAPHRPGLGAIADIDELLSIDHAARRGPEAPALLATGRSWNFAELAAAAQDLRLPSPNVHRARLDETTALVLYASLARRQPLVLLSPELSEVEAAVLSARASGPLADDTALVLFTSGSTGRPKGVQLSRQALLASAYASRLQLGFEIGDRWLCCLPLSHMGGLSILLRCLIDRKTAVLAEDGSATTVARALEEHRITHLSLVPTQLQRLVDLGTRAPGSLRVVLLGGAAASDALVGRAVALGYPVQRSYGMTEMASQVITAGVPLRGVELRVRDGVLEVRGPMRMTDYLPPDELSLTASSWFRTSDCASIDTDGTVRILGRADDMILSGGENIDPRQVEASLLQLEGIRECYALGLSDPTWGQRLVALVVLEPGAAAPDLGRVASLRGHRRPKALLPVLALPLLASGKIDRAAAERLAREGEAKSADSTGPS